MLALETKAMEDKIKEVFELKIDYDYTPVYISFIEFDNIKNLVRPEEVGKFAKAYKKFMDEIIYGEIGMKEILEEYDSDVNNFLYSDIRRLVNYYEWKRKKSLVNIFIDEYLK